MSERFVVGGDERTERRGEGPSGGPRQGVAVLERGEWVSTAPVASPDIPDLKELQVNSPENLVGKYGIDIRRRHEAVSVDPEAQIVTVDGEDGRYELATVTCC